MPPTFQTDFSYSYPVNNKWERSQNTINAIEYDMDVSLVYHLQYSRGTVDADKSFAQNMNQGVEGRREEDSAEEGRGASLCVRRAEDVASEEKTFVQEGDYNDTNSFFLFNGAINFQGQGAGYDEYSKFSSLLPANHPVLKSSLVLSVDSANAVNDIMMARNATGGAAAALWPKSEREIKLVMEEFKPLQIDWELTSIGGRSNEQ
eukprot:208291-Hanusia_phi.AAC.1